MQKPEVAFHVKVPKSLLSLEQLANIKADLTYSTTDYLTDEWVKVEYFYEDNDFIQVPRFCPLPFLDYDYVATEGTSLPDTKKLGATFSYRPGQEESVNDGISQEIITLMKPPGTGKTIIGSMAIFKRNVRSIIIVDQDNLKKQWLEALTLVFGGTIKVAKDLKFDLSKKDLGHDVYVTTIQSIIAKIRINGLDTIREAYKKYDIGFALLDECHTLIGPDKFSLFGHICNSKYVLALSATPKDNKYFQYWLGTTIVGDKKYQVTPSIVQLEFDSNLLKKRTYIGWGNKLHKDRYAKMLYANEEYLNFICSIAYKAYLKKRHVLIMCDFNEHGVDKVIEFLKRYNISELVGRFVSGCDKKIDGSKPIVVSNYKMMQKGTDIPSLDSLIMADGAGNVTALEQTIGRILRFNEGIRKKELLVFDTSDVSFDVNDIFKRRKEMHIGFYGEKKFKII